MTVTINGKEYTRNDCYKAALLATSKGYKCGAFGNACQYLRDAELEREETYQILLKVFGETVKENSESLYWSAYVNSPYYQVGGEKPVKQLLEVTPKVK